MTQKLADRLSTALRGAEGPTSDSDLNAGNVRLSPKHDAAVLIAVTNVSTPKILLTKRALSLRHHPGQVAFPGGRCDPEDADVVATALREAHEEVALPPSSVRIIGTLPPHDTVTGFHVTPVLGLLEEDFVPNLNDQEVAEVFQVPLSFLMRRENYQVQGRIWNGYMRYYYAIPFGPYYIWGASARMLRGLADGMAHGNDHG